MAKNDDKINDTKSYSCDKLDIRSGFLFGFGFLLANLLGLLILVLIAIGFVYLANTSGIVF